MRSNSKTVGDIAELKAALYYTENDYVVSKPLGDNAPYDLIVDDGITLKKVQVKSRAVRDNKIAVEMWTLPGSGKNTTRVDYTPNSFDEVFVYVPELKRAAIFNWDLIKDRSTVNLRLEKPKNNQKKNITMFEDYEIIL